MDHNRSQTSPGNYNYVYQHQYEPHSNGDFVEPPTAMSIPTPQPAVTVEDLPHHRYDPPTSIRTARTPYEHPYTPPPVHRHIYARRELRRPPRGAHQIYRDPTVGDAVTVDPRGARTTREDLSHYHDFPATYSNTHSVRMPYGYSPPHPVYYAEAHSSLHRPPPEARPIHRDFAFHDADPTSAPGYYATLGDLTHHHNLPATYLSTHTVRVPDEYPQTTPSVHYNIDPHSGLHQSLPEAHPIHRDFVLSDPITVGAHDGHTTSQSFYDKHFSLQLSPAPTRISSMLDGMTTAVERGFSYDGIVSIPEIGLEDTRHRRRLVDWLDDGVDRFRTTRAAISRSVNKQKRQPKGGEKVWGEEKASATSRQG